jgi:predicted transcriptional regulator
VRVKSHRDPQSFAQRFAETNSVYLCANLCVTPCNLIEKCAYCGKKNLCNVKIVYTFVIYYKYIMKTLSLKLDDNVFQETEQVTGYLKKSRNRYINDALDHYNKIQRRKMLETKLASESGLVIDESMRVLNEFDQIDDESAAV